MGKKNQEPWFLAINPNGRIPALTDASFTDGKPIHLWESASIMQYLVDRYDTEHKLSYPRGSREAYEVQNWVYWQMGGLGPMQGQANHFFREYPPPQSLLPFALAARGRAPVSWRAGTPSGRRPARRAWTTC